MKPQAHTLKTIGMYWDAISRGEKLFEVRRNDRFFQAGDTVRLVRVNANGYPSRWEHGDEIDPHAISAVTGDHTPDNARRILTRRIGPVLQGGQFGIEAGFCVFSLLPLDACDHTKRKTSHDE